MTLEHVFMMRTIPVTNEVQGFEVETLNAFIENISPRVQIFWLCLLRVDISEIKKVPNEALVEQTVIRVNGLELLLKNCRQLIADQLKKERKNEKMAKFIDIMNRISRTCFEQDIPASDF